VATKFSISAVRGKSSALLFVVALAVGLGGGLSSVARADSDNDNISIMMLAGPLWDPFFGAIKKGAHDAARDLKVHYQWATGTDPNNFLADYAKLVKQAATRHPSALVIGNYFPDTLDPIIKDITKQGIPVIIQHDGGATWKQDGAVGYVGFDALALGRSAAQRLIDAGAKYGLCVDHVPGNTTLENDCKGFDEAFKAAGGTSKVLMIQFSDASNQTFVVNAIKGALQSDPKLDGVWTIGAVQGVASTIAIEQLGKTGQIKNGSLALSLGSLDALKQGKLLFIADLQPYLDGYYGLLAAYQYVKYGMLPLGEIQTGPLMITKDNVDQVLDFNKKYPGVRGAS
jgi:simple sugar transport system substrate-binding protein